MQPPARIRLALANILEILTIFQTIRPNLDGMMSQLPYVLLVLFAMPDGGHTVVETAYQYDSPLSCSMRAFIENDSVDDRTYVCVTRSDATNLVPPAREQPAETARK